MDERERVLSRKCRTCGRLIRALYKNGCIESDYWGADGRCYDCTFRSRPAASAPPAQVEDFGLAVGGISNQPATQVKHVDNEQAAATSAYTSGEYLRKNPIWHTEESPWKARQVERMLNRNHLSPKTICDLGCGAGEVLRSLQTFLDPACEFCGYDISPQALELARNKANAQLRFKLTDSSDEDSHFDLLLALDVIEHLQDYFSFLARIKSKSTYKIFHFPLDLSVQTVIRKEALLWVRAHYGHLHYFTKELALQTLLDAHYDILDHFYTARATELPSRQLPRRLMNLPRRMLFALHQDLAVKLVGGWSLLVLAR